MELMHFEVRKVLTDTHTAIQKWRETGKPDYAKFIALEERINLVLFPDPPQTGGDKETR